MSLGISGGGSMYRTFEIRHFTANPAANGESDFLGPTSVLSTPERIGFLSAFATTAKRFFAQEHWDRPAVTPTAVTEALARLKPQPAPQVRRRIAIDRWRWLGSREGAPRTDAAKLAHWQAQKDVLAPGDGTLGFVRAAQAIFAFPGQDWRFLVRLRLRRSKAAGAASIAIGGALVLEIGGDGALSVEGRAIADLPADRWVEVRCEVSLDAEARCVNVEVDGRQVLQAHPVVLTSAVERLVVAGTPGWQVGDVWVQAYQPHWHVHTQIPVTMTTVVDETFLVRPPVQGWQTLDYDDALWPETDAPFAYGGERHQGEDLHLRQRFTVPETGLVWLHCETLFPGGEVWINGRVVHVQHDPRPLRLDITPFVRRGEENLLAIRVFPFRVARHIAHGSHDRHSGWFAGRTWIDVTAQDHIEDLFVTTARLAPAPALRVRARVNTRVWAPVDCRSGADTGRLHRLRLRVRSWYPDDGPVVAETVLDAPLEYFGRSILIDAELPILQAETWSPERPFLYSVEAILETAQGVPVDDLIVTTGLRTVGQPGGIFHLNDRPAMLNGGLLFGMRPPLEDQARILRCAPLPHLVREVLLAKAVGGNCIRMSVHEGTYLGCNDPRLAEIGDQLGICFLWSTTAWVRTASPWQIDLGLLAADATLVRNHPSIVMWQPGNHPRFLGAQDGMAWWREVFLCLLAVDDSRLICPVGGSGMISAPSDDGRLARDGTPIEPEPTWVHPLVARGDFDCPTGYGKPPGVWHYLRTWPHPPDWDGEFGWTRGAFKQEYLASRTHAYFDFESEETASQPNWNLLRGSPVWHVRGYERFDEYSVGRLLEFEEWELSQAWQALSVVEAYRKKRLLDYDGMFWCCLDGGGNTGTFQHPLTDHLGHAKMAFHAMGMVFQPTFAGSGNVDVSYGSKDVIPVRVIHMGEACRADVTVRLRTPEGKSLAEKTWSGIALPAGRCVVNVADWSPPRDVTGMLAVEYEVKGRTTDQ